MLALGEMSTKFPSKKGFAGHATRFVDPAFGFATAIVYLCKYLIISPNQIIAGSLVIRCVPILVSSKRPTVPCEGSS